jgi:hypothetical protein
VFGQPPSPRAGVFRDQVSHMQPFEHAPYGRAGSTLLLGLVNGPEQWLPDVGVSEAVHNVVAIGDCLEQQHVVVPCRTETDVAAAPDDLGLSELFQLAASGPRRKERRQGRHYAQQSSARSEEASRRVGYTPRKPDRGSSTGRCRALAPGHHYARRATACSLRRARRFSPTTAPLS